MDYYHVDGVFDRKSHTNRKEAEFIADLVYENADKYPEKSGGSGIQRGTKQELIEKLLAKRRKEDSSMNGFSREMMKQKSHFLGKIVSQFWTIESCRWRTKT